MLNEKNALFIYSYAVIKLGKHKKRSKTIDDGGTNPLFNNEQLLLHVPQDSFGEDVQVTLWDDDIGRDDKIGSATFSLLPHIHDCAKYRTRKTSKATKVPVQSLALSHKEKMCGELRLSTQFLPAGSLTVDVIRARNLRNGSLFHMLK